MRTGNGRSALWISVQSVDSGKRFQQTRGLQLQRSACRPIRVSADPLPEAFRSTGEGVLFSKSSVGPI